MSYGLLEYGYFPLKKNKILKDEKKTTVTHSWFFTKQLQTAKLKLL